MCDKPLASPCGHRAQRNVSYTPCLDRRAEGQPGQAPRIDPSRQQLWFTAPSAAPRALASPPALAPRCCPMQGSSNRDEFHPGPPSPSCTEAMGCPAPQRHPLPGGPCPSLGFTPFLGLFCCLSLGWGGFLQEEGPLPVTLTAPGAQPVLPPPPCDCYRPCARQRN